MILQISHIIQQMKEEIFSHTIAKKYISAPWNQDFKIMEASAEHNFGSKRLGGMLGASCILLHEKIFILKVFILYMKFVKRLRFANT